MLSLLRWVGSLLLLVTASRSRLFPERPHENKIPPGFYLAKGVTSLKPKFQEPAHKSPRFRNLYGPKYLPAVHDCMKSKTLVHLTAFSDSKPVPYVWFYYTQDEGKTVLVKGNDKGSATMEMTGCKSIIAAYKSGLDVAMKTVELSEAKFSAYIEMYPPCNYWLYISDAESLTPINNAQIMYTSKGVNRVATTDGYGETCIYACEGAKLQAVVQKTTLMAGILEIYVDRAVCQWAVVSVPHLMGSKEEMKITLNWAGDLELDLCLNVLQYKKGGKPDDKDSCLTNKENSCAPLKFHNDVKNPSHGGELITWYTSKEYVKHKYVIYVKFDKESFFSSQARIVLYCKGGHTKLISCIKDKPIKQGYWIVGCISEEPKITNFFEINEISDKKPDSECCDYWYKKKHTPPE